MSGVPYRAVNWNRQKRIYDLTLAGGGLGFLALFAGLSLRRPDATLETALIRGLSALAFTLLHLILCIGPLARLDRRFLPLLYNRRHLGVTMAIVALVHAAFATLQYHGGGTISPVASLLAGGGPTDLQTGVPFEYFGIVALVIIMLMAATSHDFWLSVLSPRTWKSLHMAVYFAWGFLVLHVTFGILRAEWSPFGAGLVAAGVVLVVGLHLAAGLRERRRDRADAPAAAEWVPVGEAAAIPDGRAVRAIISGETVAVFRHGDRISAVSGFCRHQGGPLAEGKIIDGCITCPWHGYQYRPEDGTSPPPFEDKLPTYDVRIEAGRVMVRSTAHPPGTRVEPAVIT